MKKYFTIFILIAATALAYIFIRPKKSAAPEISGNNFQVPGNKSTSISDEIFPDQASEYRKMLLGKWRRVENPDSLVVYKSDDTADAFVKNRLNAVFKWRVVTDTAGKKFSYQTKSGDYFIKEFDQTGADRYYLIKKLDSRDLKIMYLATLATLNYIRE